MKQSVQRITIEGTGFNEVEFEAKCSQFMVKNFGENPIYVSFDEDATDDESIKIAGGYYQIVVGNIHHGGKIPFYHYDTIYIKGTANDEVEVQQLCFH